MCCGFICFGEVGVSRRDLSSIVFASGGPGSVFGGFGFAVLAWLAIIRIFCAHFLAIVRVQAPCFRDSIDSRCAIY